MKYLYVTVYDRTRAQMGGAAWVDTRVREAADAQGLDVADFLVSDRNRPQPIELELRGRRPAQVRTLWRMVTQHEPYMVAKFRQAPGWETSVTALKAAWQGQTVITSQWPALLLAMDAGIPVSTHLAHNVDYRLSEIFDPPILRVLRNSLRTRRVELNALKSAESVTTLSAADRDILLGHNIRATHLRMAPARLPGPPTAFHSVIGFIGKASWPPNRAALRILQNEVMPLVRDAMGSEAPSLLLAGRETQQYIDSHTRSLGVVDNVKSFYDRIDLVVVPRGSESSGISIKVVEAWENGVHVIAPKALFRAIGVEVTSEYADDPASTAQQIIAFYQGAAGDRFSPPQSEPFDVNALWRTLASGGVE